MYDLISNTTIQIIQVMCVCGTLSIVEYMWKWRLMPVSIPIHANLNAKYTYVIEDNYLYYLVYLPEITLKFEIFNMSSVFRILNEQSKYYLSI